MEGWIKIHRKIKDHWLWGSDHRLKWWIDILLTVNHADSKILIKGKLIECKRGQSVRSLETWAKDWNVTKKTVKEFFELLQKDSMLLYESVQISTRITVCNYEDYQEVVNAKETKGKRKVNGEETDTTPKQECKEGIKNEKNVIPPTFEMVSAYCKERKNNVDPQRFLDNNEAKGWVIGKTKMKDWQAAIRTWEKNDFTKSDKPEILKIRTGEYSR
jgi:hypothetical protein